MTVLRGFVGFVGWLVEAGLDRARPPGTRPRWNPPRFTYEEQD